MIGHMIVGGFAEQVVLRVACMKIYEFPYESPLLLMFLRVSRLTPKRTDMNMFCQRNSYGGAMPWGWASRQRR
jgi:hypothetical protein